jgi:hypothetical protein
VNGCVDDGWTFLCGWVQHQLIWRCCSARLLVSAGVCCPAMSSILLLLLLLLLSL